jgi:hypothetical protein
MALEGAATKLYDLAAVLRKYGAERQGLTNWRGTTMVAIHLYFMIALTTSLQISSRVPLQYIQPAVPQRSLPFVGKLSVVMAQYRRKARFKAFVRTFYQHSSWQTLV